VFPPEDEDADEDDAVEPRSGVDFLLGAAPRGAEPRLERSVGPARGIDLDVPRAAPEQRVDPGEEHGEGQVDAHRRRERREDHRAGAGGSRMFLRRCGARWSVSETGQGQAWLLPLYRSRGVAHALSFQPSTRDKISKCGGAGHVSEVRGRTGSSSVTWWSAQVSGMGTCGPGFVTCMLAGSICRGYNTIRIARVTHEYNEVVVQKKTLLFQEAQVICS
jgi:hypothetical protein